MSLIDTTLITYEVAISEDDLRQRLVKEVLEGLGLYHEGKLPPGTSHNVLRGDGRSGGYRIRITRDMSKDKTPRLAKEGA